MKTRLLILVVALVACLSLIPLAQAAPGLHVGATGPRVAALNAKLARISYLPAGPTSTYYSTATAFAVTAFQKQAGLTRDGVAGPQTLAALAQASRPRPAYKGAGRRVEVSLSKQLLYLIKDNQVKRTLPISSGRPGLATPPGSYHVFSQFRLSYSKPYQSWMPYASYFYGGYALHGYPDYEVPNYPASHGCVRIPLTFALEYYHFVQVGDAVRVY
jgi:lipoprotein-anchoring transpeptidase ErfK/SrfK